MMRHTMRSILLMALFLISVVIQAQEHIRLPDEKREAIETLVADGTLDIDLPAHKAYVAPIIWMALDYKTKENFVKLIAVYIENKTNLDGVYYVIVYSKNTGKKIAKYNAWGYKVY